MSVMPIIGLEKCYVAKVTKDDATGATYEKPVYLEGIREIGLKVNINEDKFYAENKLWASNSVIDSIEVELDLADLDDDQEAMLLGAIKAVGGGIYNSSTDVAPEVALMFKTNKANGKARYVTLFRGKFAPADESYKGQEGKIEYQSKKLKATFAPLKFNGMYKYRIDEEDTMTDVDFFKEVAIPVKL